MLPLPQRTLVSVIFLSRSPPSIAYLARLRAMDSGVLKNSEQVIADAKEAPYSVVAPDSVVPYSVIASDSIAPDLVVAPDSIAPDLVVAPKSMEALDLELALDYVDAPDSLCVCCGMLHADGDNEACFQARRRTRTCSCCGLLHEDYDLAARIFHDLDKFDCQIYIPDVDKLVMNVNTIMVPDHIMKTLDDQLKMKQDASMEDPNKDQ